MFGIYSIGRMRRNSRRDEGASLPMLNKFIRIFDRLFGRLIIRYWKIDDRLAKQSTHPSLGSSLSNRILEVVHIHIGRRTSFDHLQAAGKSTPVAEIARDIFG